MFSINSRSLILVWRKKTVLKNNPSPKFIKKSSFCRTSCLAGTLCLDWLGPRMDRSGAEPQESREQGSCRPESVFQGSFVFELSLG